MRMIFDADPVVYGAGFAAEGLSWHVVAEDKDGALVERRFDPHPDLGGAKTQANKWLADNGLTAVSWERIIVPEPVGFALQAVRTTIGGAMRAVAEEHGLQVEDLQLTTLLSGPGNFRNELSKIVVYKGNRDPEHKPHHYQAIRDYLVSHYGAQVIEGHEADDEASIIAAQHRAEGDHDGYVVCTIDKDLDQIPGHHYDYKKHVHYHVTAEEAERWFWVQVLNGDATDNIPGCYRMGPKTSDKKVADFYREYAALKRHAAMPSQARFLWDNIVAEYAAAEQKHGTAVPWHGRFTPHEAALETARLVFMQTKRGVLWQPPTN